MGSVTRSEYELLRADVLRLSTHTARIEAKEIAMQDRMRDLQRCVHEVESAHEENFLVLYNCNSDLRNTPATLQARVDHLLGSVGAPRVSVVKRLGAAGAPLLVRVARPADKHTLFGLQKHAFLQRLNVHFQPFVTGRLRQEQAVLRPLMQRLTSLGYLEPRLRGDRIIVRQPGGAVLHLDVAGARARIACGDITLSQARMRQPRAAESVPPVFGQRSTAFESTVQRPATASNSAARVNPPVAPSARATPPSSQPASLFAQRAPADRSRRHRGSRSHGHGNTDRARDIPVELPGASVTEAEAVDVARGEVETRAANKARRVESRTQAASLAAEQGQPVTAPASLAIETPQTAPSTPTTAPVPTRVAAIVLAPVTTLATSPAAIPVTALVAPTPPGKIVAASEGVRKRPSTAAFSPVKSILRRTGQAVRGIMSPGALRAAPRPRNSSIPSGPSPSPSPRQGRARRALFRRSPDAPGLSTVSPHADEEEGESSPRTDDLPLYEGGLDDNGRVLPDPPPVAGPAVQ
jgi:hypothetical protein